MNEVPHGRESMHTERRDRATTCEPCLVTRDDGSQVAATMRNVSEDGFCVESLTTTFRQGERVQLLVLGTRIAGTIRWAKGMRAGALLLR